MRRLQAESRETRDLQAVSRETRGLQAVSRETRGLQAVSRETAVSHACREQITDTIAYRFQAWQQQHCVGMCHHHDVYT